VYVLLILIVLETFPPPEGVTKIQLINHNSPEGNCIMVKIKKFDQRGIDTIRTFEKRKNDPATKSWLVSAEYFNELKHFFKFPYFLITESL
jgi:hypothetical protein